MKRGRVIVVALTIIVVVGFGVISMIWKHRATLARQREAHYQASLRSYSEALHLGVARNEVEAYLRANGRPFRRMCCMPPVEGGRSDDDLTLIGAEPHPWYCSKHEVYIGFAFMPKGPRLANPTSSDTDTLIEIRIFHFFEDCL
jgi:hypothetical protein